MGHVHLGVLPNTVKWRAVVDLLTEGGADDDVISSSAIAVERDLQHAADDPGFVEAVRLLAMVPQAARAEDFGRALRDLGIPAPNSPDLLQIVAAVGDRLDRVMRDNNQASDFAELSRRSLLAALSNRIGDGLPGLFGATSQEVQAATARLARSRDFSALARAYFGRLLSETLSAYLDLLLRQVGRGTPFPPGVFVQAISGEHRHVIGGGVKQIGMFQKNADRNVFWIMPLVGCILITGLHVRKQIDALTFCLGLDNFEAPPVAQFSNPVEIGPQTFRITVLGSRQEVVQRIARRIVFLIKQIDGETGEFALVTGQQCLHQDQINCLDEPGVHELFQIAGHRESPFPMK